MLGQLGGVPLEAFGVQGFEGACYLLMQLQALRGDHLLVKGLAEEGMCKAVAHQADLGTLFQHRQPHSLAEGIDKDVFIYAGYGLEGLQGKLPADNGGHRKKLVALGAEQGEAPADDIP
ncbi:MAG: hypothetical protein ACNA7X_06385 [Dehalococcoidia bacterium]